MGDHRASVTIHFEFHGHKASIDDAWWNWSPDSSGYPGVDQRVLDFFRAATEAGMQRWDKQMEQYWENELKESTERSERKQLETLKAKYEPTT